MATRFVGIAAALALLTGCGSGAADKTGGSHPPVVLTVADSNNSDQPDTPNLAHFAAEVLEHLHRGHYEIAGLACQAVEVFARQAYLDPAQVAVERGDVVGDGCEG